MKIQFRRLFVPVVIIASIFLMISLVSQAPSDAELALMEYAKKKGIAVVDYPQSLVQLLERNPETKKFVSGYPFRVMQPVDLTGYNSGGVPLFLQWDEQWGYLHYDNDFVGCTGAAPMCLAMAGYYLSGGGVEFYPDEIVAFAEENGYKGDELISKGGKALGLKVTALAWEEQKIANYLKNGDPVIISTGSGEFSSYIVLTGYFNGVVTINDPASRINSEKAWTLDELLPKSKKIWVVQKGT